MLIEAYSREAGVTILFNPREVIEVYRGSNYCNVKMSNGTLHRFHDQNADLVMDALRQWHG